MKIKMPLEHTELEGAAYNDSKEDCNGIGMAEKDRIEIETKIAHPGEVNRARYMPQKENIFATKTVSGEILIYDYHKHPTTPENDEVNS